MSMTPERQKLESALHTLRLQFAQNLAAEVARLDAHLLRWQAGDEAALGAAIALAHGLAGSGSLFGRHDVTAQGRWSNSCVICPMIGACSYPRPGCAC